ncbi:MAG: rod shape-determining protein MreC [Desulfobacteraceae bacterium 4484_190.2]|nr:MAG: rod shape-determining protein MreC [Desulfobacteraceae bacterium 4484_190.2]
MKGVTGFRTIWLWVFIIGSVLFLLSSNSDQGPTWNPAEQFVIEITAPFQKLIKQATKTTEELWLNYFRLVDVHHENTQLKNEIHELKMANSRYREMLATQKSLEELIQFKQTINRPVLAAQVIGLDPTGWFKSVIIDKGKWAGLRVDMPVVNAFGVVGRVVSVSSNYAKVLLIIDQNSAVDCLVQRSRERGMLKGLMSEICRLDYVAKSNDIAVGDIVVTSGLGGVFPKGLPVGRILDAKEISGELFKDIKIRTAVDFSKLEEVLVVLEESKSSNQLKESE